MGRTNFDIGLAMFKMQRLQVLNLGLSPATANKFSDSLIYAWSEKVYPYFSQDTLHVGYEDYFKVSKETMHKIIDFADKKALKGQYLSFYDYTREFPETDIYHILDVFRYCYLDRVRFNPTFFETLYKKTAMYHSEASYIVSPFVIEEIDLSF